MIKHIYTLNGHPFFRWWLSTGMGRVHALFPHPLHHEVARHCPGTGMIDQRVHARLPIASSVVKLMHVKSVFTLIPLWSFHQCHRKTCRRISRGVIGPKNGQRNKLIGISIKQVNFYPYNFCLAEVSNYVLRSSCFFDDVIPLDPAPVSDVPTRVEVQGVN